MLGFHAMADAPLCGLPDYLTGRVSASGIVSGTLDVISASGAESIIIDPTEAPVFAVEIYPRALALSGV